MHTGCDNFWIYENIRPEPVLNLANNDNYSLAAFRALTDNYIPLPNGGGPNHLNSYLSSQNNVASSDQIGHQFKITDSQCMWPSSVYSLTFRSSYTNNFQSPETYSSQSTSLNYSTQNSQVQQNYNSKCLNTNLNFAQVYSNTNTNNNSANVKIASANIKTNNNDNNNNVSDNCNNSTQAQNSKNNVTPVSKIRVKDVFSLNNNNLHNSLLENNLLQTHQKKQTECALNFAKMNHFSSFDLRTPAEYIDYEKVNLVQSNNIHPPYECTTAVPAKPCNHLKFFQPSDLFYQKNVQVSVEKQFQSSDNKKMEKNLPSETLSNDPLIGQLSNPEKICEAGIQNIQKNSCDALFKSKRVKVQPKRKFSDLSNLQNLERLDSYISTEKTNNIHYTEPLKASERKTQETSKINKNAYSQSHYPKNLSEIDKESSLNRVSPIEELRKCRKSKQDVSLNQKYSNNQIETQKNNLVKITIPHTGHSCFIQINDSNSIEKNPTLNLPYLLESKNKLLYNALSRKTPDHNHSKTENNGVINLSLGQINQGSSISSEVTSPNINPVFSNSGPIQNEQCDAKIEKLDQSFPLTVTSYPKKLETSNKSLGSEEQLVTLNKPENYVFQSSGGLSENISESVYSEISTEEQSQSTEAISHNETLSKGIVIKQEDSQSKVESPSEQFVRENQMFPQVIKMENNVEDFSLQKQEQESPIIENLDLKNTHFVDDTENIDLSKANVENANTKKPGPKSKVISHALKNAENRIQELNVSVDNSSREKADFSPKNKMESEESKVEKKKTYQSRRKYKSKINRKKLDLLIQFLNKDEETVEMNTSEKTETSDYLKKNYFINKGEKEVHLNRNRRKLSKTCIVKNKNNSREMISLVSHKVSRVGILKCSSRNPQIAQTIKNLDKSEERFEKDNSINDGNVDFSENHDKVSIQENQNKEENCLKSDSKKINMSACEKKQDIPENHLSKKESTIQELDNISNAMRTFQNLKTHFCMGCNLISSVDSFWINVVSGELRCLNCFKKMLMKTEEHALMSKSEEVDGNLDSGAILFQKSETNQADESRKENKHKPGFENMSGNRNELISVSRLECDRLKSNDLKENIKEEMKEIINESFKGEITIKNDKEMSTISEINFSNTSKKKSAPVEDKTSLLGQTEEEQKKLKVVESLNKSSENIKWEDVGSHKSKVLDVPKQEITEIYEQSKRKCVTEHEIADETQNSGANALPTKTKQINVLKEKCSTLKTFPSNQLNKEEKNVSKERSISSKTKLLKNYNEENLSDQQVRKNDFAVSCDTNKTQVLIEGVKPELTDKVVKSSRKVTFKEEDISEEFTRVEKKKNIDTLSQNEKKICANEEFTYQKLQILEEYSKKETKIINSLNESIIKTCSKESCACQKNHSLEGIVKKDPKHEPLDKSKVQNSLKENCVDQKSKKKCLPSQNLAEKHKKIEWYDRSRKRKSADEDFAIHKVRVVEEPHAKKEIKPVTHSPNRSKEGRAGRKNKTLEHEKQNTKDSEENSGKNCSSKEECISFGNSVKEEINQVLDSSEKSKTKGDLSCQKAKTTKHHQLERNAPSEVPRRNSKDECSSLKPVITKQYSKKELRKSSELPDNLRRNSTSKEDSGSVSKRFRIESTITEHKESKTAEDKEKKHLNGKIPKKSHTGSDLNISGVLRSPLNYGSGEISNAKVKNEQGTRMKGECPNKKSSRDSFKKGKRNSSKGNEKTETMANKEQKETFQQQPDTKTGKEVENDSNEIKDSSQMLDEHNTNEEIFECPSEEKRGDVSAKESQINGEGREKSILLTELIKKTKKLSWTLLNVVP